MLCDLLLAIGDNLTTAGEPKRAFTSELQDAFSLAEASGDKIRAARACSLAMPALYLHGGAMAGYGTAEEVQWLERGDRYAPPDTPDRVWANTGLGVMGTMRG